MLRCLKFPLAVTPQRQDVNEDRTRTDELDVVRARVGETDTRRQRHELEIQVEHSRGLERGERPFVRITDHR